MESPTLVKVGVSCDPYNRISFINTQLPENEHFRVEDAIHFETVEQAYNIEQGIHKNFKEFNIPTNIQGAKTECYSKDILPLIRDYLSKTELRTHYYDPFIYVSNCDASKVIGKSLKELENDFKISKAFKARFRCVIRNLAANIVVANGAKIFYTGKQMTSFSIRGTYTETIFNILYPAFSVRIPESYDVEVKLISLNAPRKWFSKYTVATRTHISNLYSLKLYKFDGSKADNYLRKLMDYISSGNNCRISSKIAEA